MIEEGALSAVRAGADVELYDFGRSVTLSREHARALEIAFETFARQWGSQLSARIRGRAQVAVELVTMQTYDEYARSLPPSTTMVLFALPHADDDRVVMQFPLSLATSWVVQMVGGRAVETSDTRPLTAIEQSLVRALMTDAAEHLTNALGTLLPAGLTVTGIQHSSQFTQVAAGGDPVIVVLLSLRTGGRTVGASVMLPASVVLPAFANAGSTAAAAAAPELVRQHVELAPVEVALRLRSRTILPHEVLDLAVGDVLTLPHPSDRPLDLVVDDQPLAAAAVGTSGARLACVVTATTPAPAEEPA